MWGRMWSSGRGSDSRPGRERDPERERRVRSDGARKRGARRWTNHEVSPPASFNRRETEEYAKELKALEWRQAGAANEKAEEWRRIRAEQAVKYIDQCSSGEED